ncbi:MAG: tetratricopeptide repeat protein [Bacteroidales bacterium]|nr:tetratricopeptide repeat protein [Bacteroidales bacterium]
MKRIIVLTALSMLLCIPSQAQTDTAGFDVRQSLENARQLRRLCKTDQAIDTLMAALQRNTSDMEVLTELAECHTSAGNTEEAFGWWVMLSTMQPENLYFQIARAKLLYREKAYEECITVCRGITARDTIPDILAMTADAFRLAGKADSALVYYNEFLRIKPHHARTISKKADILLAAKRYDEVLEMTGPFLEAEPDNMTVLPIHGLALHLKECYPLSIETFEHQRELGDDSYAVYYYLGLNHYMMNNWPRAIKELETAYQIDSSDVTLVYQLANAMSHRPVRTRMEDYGLNPESERLYARALDMLKPSPSMMHNIYGSMAMARHRVEEYEEAIKYYELSYRYDKKNISALSSIGYCYERLRRYEEALEYYERYLKVGKKGSSGYRFVEESIAYLKQEKFMEETE